MLQLLHACAFALALIACGFEHGQPVDADAPVEQVTVSFDSAATTVDEESGTVTLAVALSAVSTATITVDYSLGTGTATRPDDFVLADGTLTFLPGQTEASVTVEIEKDSVEEGDETIVVQLARPVGATLGESASHTVTISSNILPRVSFMNAAASSSNEATSPSVEVRLSVAAKQQVTVEIDVSGTATAPDRALADGHVVTFAPGVTTQTVPIGVVQDALDEDDETVVLALQNPSQKLLLATSNTSRTHTITDDDPLPSVGYAATTSMTNENGNANLSVVLSAASGRMVAVAYAVTGGTAGGSDATLAAGTLVFSPGQTSRNIGVSVTSDMIDEPNETLVVALSSPTNATLATSAHTLTITDDDGPPQVAFAQGSVSVSEAMTSVNLTVQLSAASGFDVIVPFSLNAATTADDPDDFALASTTALTIPAGMTSANVVVNVKEDTLDEANETVVITLGTPTNATLGVGSTTTLTIEDDDASPTVAFTTIASVRNENNANIMIAVELSDASGRDVTVPFSIDAASTANDPADYTVTGSPLTIAAGNTSATLTVALKADSLDEPNETVVINLGTPTNATPVAPTTYTLTIIDDD